MINFKGCVYMRVRTCVCMCICKDELLLQ